MINKNKNVNMTMGYLSLFLHMKKYAKYRFFFLLNISIIAFTFFILLSLM